MADDRQIAALSAGIRHLEAIAEETEAAVLEILDRLGKIEKGGSATEIAMHAHAIAAACSFQDGASQRLAKVISLMRYLHRERGGTQVSGPPTSGLTQAQITQMMARGRVQMNVPWKLSSATKRPDRSSPPAS